MAVNTTHPKYDEQAPKWRRCRDVAKGQDAVHAAGELYLPMLCDQDLDAYKAYKARATFFNATWRTIAGLSGMVFSKPHVVEVPASVEPLLESVSQDGQDLGVFALQSVIECLTVGREGILVDYPQVADEGVTLADAEVLGLRPFFSRYRAEAILNWKTAVVNNRRVLTQVRLAEDLVTDDGEFGQKVEEIYRVLDLVPLPGGPVYRQRKFRVTEKDGKAVEEQIGDDVYPKMNGNPMGFIPFYCLGVDDVSIEPTDPPLVDLVDLNLAHYRVSADYENGCHFTGLPTGYVTGYVKEEGEKIYLGSQTMLLFPNPEAKVGFLEFTGQGLTALKDNLDGKEQKMAVLGARMLEQQKRAAEAAETASIHRAGESSLLASIAQSISTGIRQALQVMSDWAGGSGEVRFSLNRNFFPVPLDAQQLTALVSAWQAGAISKEALFERLQQGEVLSADREFEEEEAKITNTVSLSGTTNGE